MFRAAGFRDELLMGAKDVNRDVLFRRLNQLNMFHHYILSRQTKISASAGKEAFDETERSFNRAIETAEMFYSFLVENRMAIEEVGSNLNALIYGRLANAASIIEEYYTKEDPLKDVLIDLISFFLSTVSEKSYVDSARTGHRGILRYHAIHLYSGIYYYVKDRKPVKTGKEAEETAEIMGNLYKVLESAVDEMGGIGLFIGLYLVLYNLRAQEAFINVKTYCNALLEEA